MSEWWTYRPEDFLLFSSRTYWRLFELQNAALWPLPVLTFAAGVITATVAMLRPATASRWMLVLLAAAWLFVGWSFLWIRFAPINWAMHSVAPAFAVEALLLLAVGAGPNRAFDRYGLRAGLGAGLIITALFGLPLLAPLQGRDWAGAEVFGIAPDPTVIATLGVLLLTRGRILWLLAPIPLLWCLLSGVTLLTMGEPQAWVPFTAAALPLAAWIRPTNRRLRSRGIKS